MISNSICQWYNQKNQKKKNGKVIKYLQLKWSVSSFSLMKHKTIYGVHKS